MLTVIIPAVEERAPLLDRLVDDVKACSLTMREPVIVPHIEGTPPNADPPRVFLACEYAPTEWVLHLEDDARLGPDAHRIPMILADARCDVVSFFSLRDRPNGTESIPASTYSSTVCVALRTASIEGLGAYATAWYGRHPEHVHASDLILRDFMREHRLRAAVHYPSLVQHLPVPSALGPRSTKRQSPTYRRRYGEV